MAKLTKALDQVSIARQQKLSLVQNAPKKPKMDEPIDGYDYVPMDTSSKGSLRRDKQRDDLINIFDNPNLSRSEKDAQIQKIVEQENFHQNKFKKSDGTDYVEADHSNKGSLRKEKVRQQARDIVANPKLDDDTKKAQIQKLMSAEQLHQSRFNRDKLRNQYLRDKTLNKLEDKTKDQRFDKIAGEYYTKK